MKKTANSVGTRHVYDGNDIIANLDSSNNVRALYLTAGLDERIFMLVNENGTHTR